MERAVAIRKRILSVYNMTREDFETLNEYNDYLEQVEDIIFNLEQRVNVDAIEAQVARYREENAEMITMRAARAAERQSQLLREPLQGAAGMADSGAAMAGGLQQMDVSGPHGDVPTSTMSYMPTAMAPLAGAQMLGGSLVPQPLAVGTFDDSELSPEGLQQRQEMAMRAGGFSAEIPRMRDLEEAFCSVFVH
eukprot:jgi/Mesvir1/23778/Mv10602-RA.1